MVSAQNRSRQDLCVGLFLAILITVVFWQVSKNDFVNLDDDFYVYENRQLREGFTIENIIWAFSTFYAGNWHPLTWLSHIFDYTLYGLNPMGHHWTNVQLHCANSLLLFVILRQMTGTLWRSAFVAALFGLHPLHVESVAWVSGRKDVLSTFWGLLTLAGYYRYVLHPGLLNYLLVIVCLSLGLLAKPMLVTFPFVLLLLDYWPLKRFDLIPDSLKSDGTPGFDHRKTFRLILEKIPLVIPVVISAILTFTAQKRIGAVFPLEMLPLQDRIANALVSYVNYVFKAIWPRHLAVYYPHPGDTLAGWKVLGSALLIMAVLIGALRVSKRYPYIVVGLLWYFGTLVPVIGLVQVGGQALADRYTYIPLTGIFIAVAWGAFDFLEKWRYQKIFLAVSATITLSYFTAYTYVQAGHWKDTRTLYQNAINVTDNNYFAYNGLGVFLHKKKDFDAAIYNYEKALHINPDYADAHSNLGLALSEKGKIDAAVLEYKEALKIKPDNIAALFNLGNALADLGKFDEAVFYYKEALKLKPDFVEAHYNLANTQVQLGNDNEADIHYAEALRIYPRNEKAHYNYGNLLLRQGKPKQAMFHFAEALKQDPYLAEAYDQIGVILARQGKYKKARVFFLKAIQIRPNYTQAQEHLENYKANAVVHK